MKPVSFILLLASLFAHPSLKADGSHIIQHESVYDHGLCYRQVFAEYDSWLAKITESSKTKVKTEKELEERMARFKDLFPRAKFESYKASLDCETFTYKAGDVPVLGYAIRPKGAHNLPIIVYNRGGNGSYGGVIFAHMMLNLFPLAEQGFVIVGSQYRGTFQVEPDFTDEFGGADVVDVVALVNLAESINGADPERLGMLGSSRGGMQTFLTARQLDSIKAIATQSAMTDLLLGLETRPEMENVYKQRIPDYQTNKDTVLKQRSVVYWVDELDKDMPILLIHGSADKRVDAGQSLALAGLLKANKHPHKLVIYEDDVHYFTNNSDKALEEVATWFKAHL